MSSPLSAPFDPKSFIAGLPNLPGVYRMLGSAGEVLYVGKAGDLRKRVGSYFDRNADPSTRAGPRIQMMVSHVASIETTVTRSEAEALLLENNLIKSLAPRYNILFRDDKSYPYLMISGSRFPRVGFHRGARHRHDRYYGPFPHAHAVREAIQLLQRVFRLRTCEDSVFENRSRPCLLHQIGRCTAPCTALIDEARYAEDVRNAELFLAGKEDVVVASLSARMQEAAQALRYEEAASYRDQIRALARVQARQYVESSRGLDADVIACAIAAGTACINLAMIRGGRHVGDRSFFPQNAQGAGPAEVIAAFVTQHYDDQPVPPLVLVSEAGLGDALREDLEARAGHPVQVAEPAQGERRMWIEMGLKNALLSIEQRERAESSQDRRLAALREVLGLPETAQRIECFDVSHTMGEATVASCVVFDQRGMQRGEYRRYNIAGITPGDDYAAMRQTLSRRYLRASAEAGKIPDLILIDGGKGQVGAARAALAELGVNDVAIVGVAKGPERRPGMEELILAADERQLDLPAQHPALHLIQSIRDEAHRFAIVGHRARRSKSRRTSALNEIPGIGAKRRQRLLAHFGGLRGVQAAAVDEISRVDGIGRSLAEQIYRHLHEGVPR
jgi:excinuclease ABC subunit C